MAFDTPPVRLGDYEILEPLAEGGMGKLYLARPQSGDHTTVVVKCAMLRAPATKRDRVRMFLDEARVTTLLVHPNIVRVYEVGYQDGCYFMVMERLEGWDLHEIASRLMLIGQALPLPIILRLLIDACAGLEAAHTARTERGVPINLVHRDIGPANLFVTKAGMLKILDFGVAKSSIQLALTENGALKGKPAYMSPEQCRSEPLDGRSDIFALGVVLHELLTGKRLFRRPSDVQTWHAILNDFVPPPARDDPPIPDSLVAITMRALQRARELRYASARELGNELLGLTAQHGAADALGVAKYLADIFNEDATEPELGQARQAATRRLTEWADIITNHLSNPITSSPVVASSEKARLLSHDTVRSPPRFRIGTLLGEHHTPQRRYRTLLAMVLTLVVGVGAFALGRWQPPMPAELPAPQVADPAREALALETDAPPRPAAEPQKRHPRVGESLRIKTSTPTERPTKTAKPAPPPGGRLTLESRPWARVYLGKRYLGDTPLVNYPLPSGSTTLRLRNPDTGIEKIVLVDIPVNDLLRQTVLLQNPGEQMPQPPVSP